MKIVIPDVGQGNCLGIFSISSLLVDCGGENNKIKNFDNFILKSLRNQPAKVIITHYHFDHYNFLSRIQDKFFGHITPSLTKFIKSL